MTFVRPVIATTNGYIPGEQPKPGTNILKLNTNENPYAPSPNVMEALHHLDGEWLRRYPDPYAKEFCRAVSDVFKVPQDWIIVGNGSDDLLNLLIRSCAEVVGVPMRSPYRRTVVYPTPTYVLYRTLADMHPADVLEVPYPTTFDFPLDRLIAANGAITLIASPNAPSGHEVPLDDIRQLAQSVAGLVIVDEAYVDFGNGTALPLVHELDNVMVLRTLSKGYSLAGLRLGYGIARPALLQDLFKVKDSYNVDAVAIALGTAAIRDQAYKNACAEKVKRSRTTLTHELQQLEFHVLPSCGNFVLTTPPPYTTLNAQSIYLALKERGILVRYFNQPGLNDKLRITVGTDAQIQKLIQALIAILATHNP